MKVSLLLMIFVNGLLIGLSLCSRVDGEADGYSGSQQTLTWTDVLNQKASLKNNITNIGKPKLNSINLLKRTSAPEINNRPRTYKVENQSSNLSDKQILNPSHSLDPTKLQKRALDFIYHKFVEPKLHHHIKPRPSLIEDLIVAFDKHVQKDLKAWERADSTVGQNDYKAPASTKSNSKKNEDLEAQSSGLNAETAHPPQNSAPITSVAHVQEGETDDTFLVTDDSGTTHVITVDEIINSLKQMDEDTISDLLLGSPRIDPSIERIDKFSYPDGNQDFFPPIMDNVQYSRKGTDDNDVILIKSEDGDTRLVTVKDLKNKNTNKRTKETKKITTRPAKTTPNPVKLSSLNPVSQDNQKALNQNSFITLEDLMKLNNQHGIIVAPPRYVTVDSKNIHQNAFKVGHSQNKDTLKNTQNLKREIDDPLASIRKSLQEIHQNQRNKVSNTPLVLPQTSFANFHPLGVVTTESPLINFLPLQNTPVVKPNTSPEGQKVGFRGRISNFFSKLIGKPVTDINVPKKSEPERDQIIQVVIPQKNSDIAEKIIIPLPKPIHFRGRKIHSLVPPIQKRNDKLVRAQRRTVRIDPPSVTPKLPKIDSKMTLGEASKAESILKTAKIPESVRNKLLQQIKENKDTDLSPLGHSKEPAADEQIDRFFVVKNKAKKKDVEFPIGYTYQVPSYDYIDPYNPYVETHETPYVPHYDNKGHHHKHKGKNQHDDKPPLIDFSLLADLVYLSKIGDDNESFQFPKVGDSHRFVDTRKHYH